MRILLSALIFFTCITGATAQDNDMYDFAMGRINELHIKINADPENPLYYSQLRIYHGAINMYHECLDDINKEIELYKNKYANEDLENGNPPRFIDNGFENPQYQHKETLFSLYNRKAQYLVYLNLFDQAYTLASHYKFGNSYDYKGEIDLFRGNAALAVNGFLQQKQLRLSEDQRMVNTYPGDGMWQQRYNDDQLGNENTNMNFFVGYFEQKEYTKAKEVFQLLADTGHYHAVMKEVERVNGQRIHYRWFLLNGSYYDPSISERSRHLEPYVMLLLDYLTANNYDSAFAVVNRIRFSVAAAKKNADGSSRYDSRLLFQCALYNLKAQMLTQKGLLEDALDVLNKSKLLNPFDNNTTNAIINVQNLVARQKNEDRQPPQIEIYQPGTDRSTAVTDDLTTDPANQFTVIGRAIDISGIRGVKVNGAKADVLQADGTFKIQLTAFAPSLTIEATDNNGNAGVKTFHVKKTDSGYIPPIDETFNAIMISCSHYSGSLPPLPTTIAEADGFAAVLQNKYNFDQGRVLKLYDKNYDQVIQALAGKLDAMKENDNLVIYFAGHGTSGTMPNGEKIGFWVPIGAEQESEYISSQKLNTLIKGCKARHILIISDACFSAAMIPGEQGVGEGVADEMSSREIMTSGAFQPVPGESFFLNQVIEKLTTMDKSTFSDKILFSRIYEAVLDKTHTEPLLTNYGFSGNKYGHFYFKKAN